MEVFQINAKKIVILTIVIVFISSIIVYFINYNSFEKTVTNIAIEHLQSIGAEPPRVVKTEVFKNFSNGEPICISDYWYNLMKRGDLSIKKEYKGYYYEVKLYYRKNEPYYDSVFISESQEILGGNRFDEKGDAFKNLDK